jgi:hypothetical protein
MWRFARKLHNRLRLILAVAITALALSAVGFGIAVAHQWAACRNFSVQSYPKSYPQCRSSAQSDRPMLMAGSGAVFLVAAVVAVYLWTDESTRAAATRRTAAARRSR